jgi:hypothetical protein
MTINNQKLGYFPNNKETEPMPNIYSATETLARNPYTDYGDEVAAQRSIGDCSAAELVATGELGDYATASWRNQKCRDRARSARLVVRPPLAPPPPPMRPRRLCRSASRTSSNEGDASHAA